MPPGAGTLDRPRRRVRSFVGCSVTGGYVYRGANPACKGRTSTATTAAGACAASRSNGGKMTALRHELAEITVVTSFGEDGAGELYGVSHGGTIYRLTP